jgi:hypothetical protein
LQRKEREEKEIKEIRTGEEVWKYINRERKKKGISERGNNIARLG